ncbi:MAG: response regulator, partial [Lachnospiraceae bacterium]|nr:response regulator [Lachnospiraceae bacterium]
MKKISTISSAALAQTMEIAGRIFDIVRLVDPHKMCIVTIDEAGNLTEGEECYSSWGYETRCSNCTGLCAMDTACSISKTEQMGKTAYQVTSNIVYVIDADKKMRKLVIELLSETVPETQSQGNTVLIVDDQAVNRMIAGKILSDQYSTLEASDGQEALDILEKEYESISAVILDLIMPGYDGYTVLRFMKNDPRFSKIPVLVMTGDVDWKTEKKCLESGAWDIIAKPVNKDSLKLRMENIIGRSRYDAQKFEKYLAEHDALTGLYNRTKFFQEIHKVDVNDHPSEYALLHVDIDRFRLYNSFFGEKEGDRLLVFFANLIKECAGKMKESVVCRMEADVFGVFCRYEKEDIEVFSSHIVEKI